MFEKIKYYYNTEKIIKNEYTATITRCLNALQSAATTPSVSILGSGDTGVYGISSIILERSLDLLSNIEIEIVPGITSAFSGAALLGSPLTQDFAVISLSDYLTDSEMMKKRIIGAARSDFGIVFYCPCNTSLVNLSYAKDILLKYRSPETSVGIVSNIGDNNQKLDIINLQNLLFENISSLTTIFVGKKSTYISKNNKMITPLY
jgi:precorrin-3B C17-methyltransferase